MIPEELRDFRNFLFVVWKHLNLPEPTPVQYDIAEYIQSNVKRSVIEAFRGVGKSYITSAYCCHTLLLDPQKKILVVSASKIRADDFSTFTQRLINEMPLLAHLRPREGQRMSKISFDVGPTKASHSPSVKSVGITGQLAGSRADLVVADDIEIPNNSATQTMRDKIAEAVKEFDAILKPDGRIMYLGTPQTEMSLYELLPERGYQVRIWPARYPTEKQREKYHNRLSSLIADTLDRTPECVNEPIDPQRFNDEDLLERELSYGRSGFSLQFMLDTSLSDRDRYPLKLSDLIIMDVDNDKAPEKLIWTKSVEKRIGDLPNVGLPGDHYHNPLEIVGSWINYTGSIMTIDPAGRGQDETAFAVVKMLNGNLYLIDAGGLQGGYNKDVLMSLAVIAKKYKVNLIRVESNFGDGMFSELFKPYLTRIYPVTIEEERSSTQKEKRIVSSLEPVMNQHRLIVNKSIISSDYKSTQKYPADKATRYMLFYQMSRLTQERGALAHDDRLDALAMAVQYWTDQMAVDADKKIVERKDDLLFKELDHMANYVVGKERFKVSSNNWLNI
jgi:hypothetical protein